VRLGPSLDEDQTNVVSDHSQENMQGDLFSEDFCAFDNLPSTYDYNYASVNLLDSILANDGVIGVSGCMSTPSDTVDSYLCDATQRTLDFPSQDFISGILKLCKMASPMDGFCILHSVSTGTGVSVDELKKLIRKEYESDKDGYENYGVKKKELEAYLVHGNYNTGTVDSVLNILAKITGRCFYIFEDMPGDRKVQTGITKIVPSYSSPANTSFVGEPLFFLKSFEHYDSLLDLG